MNYGYKDSIIDDTQWVLGAFGAHTWVPLMKEGQWFTYRVPKELQALNGFETYNCTSFNTLNRIEELHAFLFDEKVNYSDRFLGIMAGTGKGGNDPHTVCEAVRKHGLIPESMLPYSKDITSIEEYYSFKGADEEACRRAGQEWLKQYDFFHDWVFNKTHNLTPEQKHERIEEALRYSPIAVSVRAWSKDDDGIYVKDIGEQDNHWTGVLDQYILYYLGEDTYEPTIKKLHPLYDFGCAKRFALVKKEVIEAPEDELQSLILRFIELFKRLLAKLK